ncbi:unnamed protein product [Urochloa humidicola]
MRVPEASAVSPKESPFVSKPPSPVDLENPAPPPPPPLPPYFFAAMSNFAVDPHPFVPQGFNLQPREIFRGPARMRSFLAFTMDKSNEDLAIAVPEPHVAKEDFWPFARALRRFLLNNNVREPEIQQCPMGDAFVRFDSALQRESFLMNGPRQFEDYQLSFIRHDEGPNMKDLELDRTAWLMLLCFLPDVKNLMSLVDKSLAGFGQLLHVHRSSSLARLIVKVLVNQDADVPDSITLSVGTYPHVRSWTVPVYLLSATDVVLGGDEDPIPVEGPTHPLPHPAPGWMGPVGPPVEDEPMEDAASGAAVPGAAVEDLGGHDQQAENIAEAADVAGGAMFGAPGLQNKSLTVATNISGASADFAASEGIKSASPLGPASFQNQVVMDPEKAGQGLKRPREAMATASDDDDVHIVSKEEATSKGKPRRKRRASKPREPLGPSFVRRSTRTNKALVGFRNKGSMPAQAEEEAQDGESEKEADVEVILEPSPLAVVPPVTDYAGIAEKNIVPAPYLNVDNVRAMAVGYLKMQPGAVSASALFDSSDDE